METPVCTRPICCTYTVWMRFLRFYVSSTHSDRENRVKIVKNLEIRKNNLNCCIRFARRSKIQPQGRSALSPHYLRIISALSPHYLRSSFALPALLVLSRHFCVWNLLFLLFCIALLGLFTLPALLLLFLLYLICWQCSLALSTLFLSLYCPLCLFLLLCNISVLYVLLSVCECQNCMHACMFVCIYTFTHARRDGVIYVSHVLLRRRQRGPNSWVMQQSQNRRRTKHASDAARPKHASDAARTKHASDAPIHALYQNCRILPQDQNMRYTKTAATPKHASPKFMQHNNPLTRFDLHNEFCTYGPKERLNVAPIQLPAFATHIGLPRSAATLVACGLHTVLAAE